MSRDAQGAAAENEGQQKMLHILAVPFQQDGHINGMLRLARALAAQENVLVTFGYPARYHGFAQKRNELSDLLSTSSSANKNSKLRVEVVEDGLPREEEQGLTSDLVRASVPIFQNAVKLLLEELLNRSKPSSSAPLPPLCCIISDTFMPWTQDLANAVGLPRIDFWTSSAAVYSMGSQLAHLVANGTVPLPTSCWVDSKSKWKAEAPLIDCVPGLPPFPPTDLPSEFVKPEEISNFKLQFMLASFSRTREAHTILVHSVYELERKVFDALQANGLPIYAVGPLLQSLSEPLPSTKKGNGMADCLQWLNTQRPLSVIYVALGTVAKLTPTETHSLALGLEASGHPFLWVIRRDSISGSVSDILPEGFLQRTVEKGLGLIISWAPQTEVLRHYAIGTFFSHCGWNSTLECMWEGVPMVACPREAEQRSNARWIVENWKFGVELEREDDGSFTKEAVQIAVKKVLGLEGKDGVSLKERALEIKKVARASVQKGGTSHSNLVGFLNRFCVSPTAPCPLVI